MATPERRGSKDFAGNRTPDDYRESPPYLAHMLDNYLAEVASTIARRVPSAAYEVRNAPCKIRECVTRRPA
jgi:hypothetical protein